MKRRNVILTMVFAVLFAKGAQADEAGSVYEEADSGNIEEASSLLGHLAEIGAVEVDQNENVYVKKSVVEKLKKTGRVQDIAAKAGTLCD